MDTPCIVVPGVSHNRRGYARCKQRRFGRTIHLRHVLAWVDAHGKLPPPEAPHVLHTCDNPPCENVDHLWVGTRADNNQDMARKGRARGRVRATCPAGHDYEIYGVPHSSGYGRRCVACRPARLTTMIRLLAQEAQADGASTD